MDDQIGPSSRFTVYSLGMRCHETPRKMMVLLIPEFCPGGQGQRLTVNNSTLLV